MASQALVPAHVCLEVKALYEQRDVRGRRIYSFVAIGKLLGLSETTVYRIVNGLGAYQQMDRLQSSTVLSADAAASAAKLLQMLQATPPAEQSTTKEKPDGPADPFTRDNPYYKPTER